METPRDWTWLKNWLSRIVSRMIQENWQSHRLILRLNNFWQRSLKILGAIFLWIRLIKLQLEVNFMRTTFAFSESVAIFFTASLICASVSFRNLIGPHVIKRIPFAPSPSPCVHFRGNSDLWHWLSQPIDTTLIPIYVDRIFVGSSRAINRGSLLTHSMEKNNNDSLNEIVIWHVCLRIVRDCNTLVSNRQM